MSLKEPRPKRLKQEPLRADSSLSLDSAASRTSGNKTPSSAPKSVTTGSETPPPAATPAAAAALPDSAKPSNEVAQAGFAQNDRELRDKIEKEMDVDDDGSSDEDGEAYRKRYNRMEAKLRRFCTVKTSGRSDADKQLMTEWKQKGHCRVQLVKLMMEANGCRELQSLMLHGTHE